MDKKIQDKLFKAFIWLFAALYFCIASISCYHCVEFCMVGNPLFLSIIMSAAFEIGLALTLFAVLINDNAKNNIVSWVLMTLLTCVQVMGNIFSVEKYMEVTNNGFYVYIQNGFLHWFTDDMPEKEIMSIIAIILGALLPFVALLMTSMVASNWKNHVAEMKALEEEEKKKNEEIPLPPPPPPYEDGDLTNLNDIPNDFPFGEIDNFGKIEEPEYGSTPTPETSTEISKNENEEEKEFKDINPINIDVPEVGNAEKLLNEKEKEENGSQEILDIKPEIRVNDGSLLSPQEHEEMVRNTVHTNPQVMPHKPAKPTINFFAPNN